MTDPDPAATGSTNPTPDNTPIRVELVKGLFALAVACVTFVGGLFIGNKQASDGPVSTVTTTVTATPTQPGPIHLDIVAPLPEATADVCTIVTGKLPPVAKGKALVVAQRQDRDNRIYFSNELDLTKPELWSTMVYLGDIDEPADSKNKHFSIWAIVVDQALVDYSFGTNRNPEGPRYWDAATFLPGLDPGAPVRVIGSGVKGDCGA
jgi:hypothetical protein